MLNPATFAPAVEYLLRLGVPEAAEATFSFLATVARVHSSAPISVGRAVFLRPSFGTFFFRYGSTVVKIIGAPLVIFLGDRLGKKAVDEQVKTRDGYIKVRQEMVKAFNSDAQSLTTLIAKVNPFFKEIEERENRRGECTELTDYTFVNQELQTVLTTIKVQCLRPRPHFQEGKFQDDLKMCRKLAEKEKKIQQDIKKLESLKEKLLLAEVRLKKVELESREYMDVEERDLSNFLERRDP